MGLPVATLVLLGGLALLVVAADRFVVGAEAVAVRRGWSPAVIGAVVVGFGTSLPELVTSVLAAVRDEAALALGNAAGSNVANLLLILGMAAVVAPVVGAREQAPRRDAVAATLASLLLLGLATGGRVSLPEGAALLAGLAAMLAWQLRSSPSAAATAPDLPRPPAGVAVGWQVVGGLLGVLLGAQLLVAGATDLATAAGLPPLVIGTLLVAVGTSLPELATAVASARRGQVELLFGNLLGSNAFNATAVVGASAVVAGLRGEGLAVAPAGLAVVTAAAVVTIGAGAALSRRPTVSRVAGAVLVALYLAAIPVLVAIS